MLYSHIHTLAVTYFICVYRKLVYSVMARLEVLGKQIFLLPFHDFFVLSHCTFESDFRSSTRKRSLQVFLFLKVYILLVHNMMVEF